MGVLVNYMKNSFFSGGSRDAGNTSNFDNEGMLVCAAKLAYRMGHGTLVNQIKNMRSEMRPIVKQALDILEKYADCGPDVEGQVTFFDVGEKCSESYKKIAVDANE